MKFFKGISIVTIALVGGAIYFSTKNPQWLNSAEEKVKGLFNSIFNR